VAKIVFMGSPAFAVPSLQALHAEEHEIVAVYTQPPRPAGRGQALRKTAVHEVAEELGLAVFHPEKLKGADLDFVLGLDAEVFCVVAYGLLLPKVLVDERLCLNVHPSALPKWRGAAPLQWTLMSGEATTDICVMKLDAGMDTGPVVLREKMEIDPDLTLGELHDMAADTGAMMLAEVIDHIKNIRPIAQVGEATHAVKITPAMRVIDWNKGAREVHNLVRGLSPSPAATAKLGEEVFKVLKTAVVSFEGAGKEAGKEAGKVVRLDTDGVVVACGEGAVRLVEIQRPGGKPVLAADAVRGWAAMAVGVDLT
jgi:methionyl-tRNA formyltransferase